MSAVGVTGVGISLVPMVHTCAGEVVEDKAFHVGDLAMENRIANIDDGSYPATFNYFNKLQQAGGSDVLWVPCHGNPRKDLLATYGTFLRGIREPSVQALKCDIPIEKAKALVLQDPRVASRAKSMLGFAKTLASTQAWHIWKPSAKRSDSNQRVELKPLKSNASTRQ